MKRMQMQKDIFQLNEEKANRYTAYCMVIAAIVTVLMFLLPSLLIRIWKRNDWLLKYIIMGCFLLGVAILASATDRDNQLYGAERMLDALNRRTDAGPQELLEDVKADIDGFVGDAMQFDDITMMALKVNKIL